LAGLIPPLNGPDEPAHFDYVQRVVEDLRLPVPISVCAGLLRRRFADARRGSETRRRQRPQSDHSPPHVEFDSARASEATSESHYDPLQSICEGCPPSCEAVMEPVETSGAYRSEWHRWEVPLRKSDGFRPQLHGDGQHVSQ